MDMEYLESAYQYNSEDDKSYGQIKSIRSCRPIGAIKKTSGKNLWGYRKFVDVCKKKIKVEVDVHTPWHGMDEYIKQCKRSELNNMKTLEQLLKEHKEKEEKSGNEKLELGFGENEQEQEFK